MPIATTCPACQHAYRLKDELAGKRVKCKNPACQETFTVPKPQAAPVAAPIVDIDADTVAAAALAEEQVALPADQRLIAMVCNVCSEAWTEPWDKQGKNVLCPECRARQKVPVQKAAGPSDWRGGRGGPSLARQPELEGVNSSGNAGYVSGEALRGAGLGRPELEPRPLWQKVAFVAGPIAAVLLLVLSVQLVRSSRAESTEAGLMTAALEAMPTPAGDAMPKAEVAPARAALLIVAGHYNARRAADGEIPAVEAVKLLGSARQELDGAAATPERDFLWGELVGAQLALGGDAEAVNAERKLRWVPQAAGAGRARVSEKAYSVQDELRRTFEAMKTGTPPETRFAAFRTAAHAFAQAGLPDAAGQLVPFLFADEGAAEAQAQAAAEAYRVNGDAEKLGAAVANGLAGVGKDRAAPPTLLALAQLAPKPPGELPMPALTDAPDDRARAAHGTLALLKKNVNEAVAIAKRPGRLAPRLTLLSLASEWGDDPAPAATAAAEILTQEATNKDAGVAPDGVLIRLAAAAGRAGLEPQAETIAKAAGRDDAQVLARALAASANWKRTPTPKPDSAWEVPAKADAIRLGHLWGRMALARANAAAGEGKPAAAFEGVAKPFGLAGAAMGRQDRSAK